MSSFALTLIIAIAALLVGIVVFFVQRFKLYRSYEEIAGDARKITSTLKAEVFRDGDDLVLSGSYGGFPTVVRFSHGQNTPGLNIQMRSAAAFDLSLSPKKVTTAKGRTVVRTGNNSLDARFSARTDHPAQTKMVFNSQPALQQLEKLCCSSQTEFGISPGLLELSELAIPNYAARHVVEHITSMEVVAALIQKMPGAQTVKFEPIRQSSSRWLFRAITIAGGVTIVALLLTHREKDTTLASSRKSSSVVPEGMTAVDASKIQRLQGWHVAREADFSTSASDYLRNNDLALSGHVTADFAGDGGLPDSAYLLRDSKGRSRISLVIDGVTAYDAIFPRADLIAGIPKANLQNVQWVAAPEFPPDGDALLVVQDAGSSASAVMLLKHGSQIYSARPADFTKLNPYPED
jgi:hypothetical protein